MMSVETTATTTTTPPPRASAYQCGICKEQYSRPDHLIRHVRTHTKQRPFVCAVCTKAFARQDLLKRHALAHHKSGHTAEVWQNPDALQELGRYGPRVDRACRQCAEKKLKCSDEKPCKRCKEKSLDCYYNQGSEPSQQQTPAEGAVNSTNSDSITVARRGTRNTSKTPGISWPTIQNSFENVTQAVASAQYAGQSAPVDTDQMGGAFSDFEMPPSQMENLTSSHDVASDDVLGFTFDLPSFGDYLQQDAEPNLVNFDLPFFEDFVMSPATQSVNQNLCSFTTHESPVMGIGTEAYHGSVLRKGWNPLPEDKSPGTESLELPSDVRSEVMPTMNDGSLTLRKDELTVSTRDKILAMIYARTSKSIWERMSMTFESVDVLRGMIHHAFSHMQEQQMIPFVHISSFDLNKQRPELLCALIAYGAVSLPSASMRKFGYGLQELVGIAINHKLEEEPTAVRDLGIAQAFYIQLNVGFWSAISAKIEAAESRSMLGATMLRRGKMFQAGNYQPAEAFLGFHGLSLQQKWAKWVDQESRIRLVYFAMLLDAGVSLARNINPLFAYSEVATPLPAACRLWEAATAETWHEVLVHDNQLRLSLAHPLKALLREPHLIRVEQNILDINAAGAAALAGYWLLVYEYRQMENTNSGVQDRNNFVLHSRHAELASLLEQLRMELADLESLRPEVLLWQELVLLHLNAAYYEVSAYSGRGTMEDAQAAKPYVQWWNESHQARHAIFHAGQIFRLVKDIKPATLTDMSVIALYHATETLWVWGLMQRSQQAKADASSSVPVVLDEDESPGVARFLRTSRGQPGLNNSPTGFVPLVEPALISDLANDIIRLNWGEQVQSLTTSEVSRIVQGFSKICRQRFAP